MRVLLLGSGGRESALASGLARSRSVGELIAAPGNPGIATLGETREVAIEDPGAVTDLARYLGADLVVVGPEAPLVAGVSDGLRGAGIAVFGPDAAAARIEGSKAYAKELMAAAGIATARAAAFTDAAAAVAHLRANQPPYVIKADGLAAGKGVEVTSDRAEAEDAVVDRLERGRFGAAGATVLIEEYLPGEEASLIAFTDGKTVLACPPAQDYKRVFDGDEGPNTGGMGSYSPVPACPPDLAARIVAEVLEPMVVETARRGAPFVGALYAGLALTPEGPRVIEFNARFGDPETQALVPRLAGDLGEACMAAATGSLAGVELGWRDEACVAVVLASGGYPGDYRTGVAVEGVPEAAALPGVEVFHAGTALEGASLVTAGGRVLVVSALGETFSDARHLAYRAAEMISFQDRHMRTDIGARAEGSEVGASAAAPPRQGGGR